MREPFSKARVYITVLLVIEIVLGALIISTTGIYHHILGTYLAETERKMLTGQLFNTYLLGFQVIATYLGSIFMWNSLWLRPCSPNICLLLSVWLFFTFLVLICACATMYTLYMCAHAIHATAEASLTKGIDLYYSCPEWKLLWDSLQFYRECCGVRGYTDWMKATWMPSDALSSSDNPPESTPPCGSDRKSTALAPYACCKHSCNACFDNYIPRYGNVGIPYLNLTQINTDGCLPLFEGSLWECINLLIFFVICSIFIDIMMFFLTRVIVRGQEGSNGFTGEELDGDENKPLLVMDDSKEIDTETAVRRCSNYRANMKAKIDRRLVNRSPDQKTRKDASDCEEERRACFRSAMEREAERRSTIRSEMEAEAKRRATIRARMEAEHAANMRSQWNAQRRRSEWSRESAGMDQPQRQDARATMHQDACNHGVSCSGCAQTRNVDSGESRFVH